MAANAEAKKKKLAVAVGHHLRHEAKYRDAIERIHDGAIGDLQFMRVYFNDPAIWVRPRRPGQSEMQYQVRNWYHFNWLSGEQIVEMHVHSLDIGNWIAKGHPVEAQGMGGRQVCVGRDMGDIFDHHAVEYTFADGAEDVQLLPHHLRLLEYVTHNTPMARRAASTSKASAAPYCRRRAATGTLETHRRWPPVGDGRLVRRSAGRSGV